LLGGGAVALVALLREDGADAGLEEVELLRCWWGLGFAAEGQRGKERREDEKGLTQRRKGAKVLRLGGLA
jgi:hypothetical protein